MNHTPEKLSIWDRLFNRYRTEVVARGEEDWQLIPTGLDDLMIASTHPYVYRRDWVDYRMVDRLTGSETISRTYLN